MTFSPTRAAELLALRDKATPGPYIATNETPYPDKLMALWVNKPSGSMQELWQKVWGCGLRKQPDADEQFVASIHDICDQLAACMEELERVKAAAQAMVDGHHAGPITTEMYDAWEAARRVLAGE